MKYVVMWPDSSSYGSSECAEIASSKDQVTKIIEDLLDNDDSVSQVDLVGITVFELGNEISLERKVLLKESVIVK